MSWTAMVLPKGYVSGLDRVVSVWETGGMFSVNFKDPDWKEQARALVEEFGDVAVRNLTPHDVATVRTFLDSLTKKTSYRSQSKTVKTLEEL